MIYVKIPATSANVGSGFDSVGFALKLYNEIWVEEAPEGVLEIESLGGDVNVPKDENNLIYSTNSVGNYIHHSLRRHKMSIRDHRKMNDVLHSHHSLLRGCHSRHSFHLILGIAIYRFHHNDLCSLCQAYCCRMGRYLGFRHRLLESRNHQF